METNQERFNLKKEQRLTLLMQWEQCKENINSLMERQRNIERNIILLEGEMSELNYQIKLIPGEKEDV